MRRTADISYRGPFEGQGYQGLFAYAEDREWRAVRNPSGALAYFATPDDAEAAARAEAAKA